MMMKKSNRGSALMISLVIVILTAGIGGAFLAQSLMHSNEQKWSIEADEAYSMCDAGMERARHALGIYRGEKLWNWTDIATYCGTVGRPANSAEMRADAMRLFQSAAFSTYSGAISQNGTLSAISGNSKDPRTLMPQNQLAWSPSDESVVLFGNSIPFQRGAVYIRVTAPPGLEVGKEPDNLIVTVTATLQGGVQRQVEGVLSKPTSPLSVKGLAAVVSNDEVSLNGSIIIDGRDHDYTGTTVTGDGVFGIISNAPMSPPTNGAVGGNGMAPPKPKGSAAGSVKGSYDFPNGYPSSPDGALSMPDGSTLENGALKKAAQDGGTYFSSQSAYTTWLSANGGKMPDGKIVYLEFTPGNGMFNLGSGNAKSSILVVHTENQSGIMKEVHGNFTGLILADGFVRNNGTSHITGMIQLFSPTSSEAGNVFGNGNAEIDFSSAALADLPGMGGSNTPANLTSYRRIQ